MTDRLSQRFAACRAQDRAALITFVTAGDPNLATSAALLRALVAAGADIIELGMPFTDPMADGPAIQLANIRALGAGATLAGLLAMVRDFRSHDSATPVVLMGYVNPLLAYGVERFAADAATAGVDGVIIVDVPPEEDAAVAPALSARGLHLVRLTTPTTDAARLPFIVGGASGFVYHVAVAGVTGMASAEAADMCEAVQRLRAATSLPIAVGFGIKTPVQAAAVARKADGVVVGSAIVSTIGQAIDAGVDPLRPVADFVQSLSDAIRTARMKDVA